jgi:2,4-dienoyl-CoA reductase-like NADH-dependent reductase (Old Yellow Enzyme family)
MLFTPLNLKSVMLKNRIAMSPMCQYSAKNGFVDPWHLTHYGTRAVGGAALIIVEATAVTAQGRITPADLGIWDDGHIEGLAQLATTIKAQGAVAAIQLAHAGRKASHAAPWEGGHPLDVHKNGWTTIGPSPIAFGPNGTPPMEMTQKDIDHTLQCFKDAAKRALTAGFQAIEIHAAHGYLLQEFLSPLSNHRTDRYGGPFENRIRLLLETIAAVKTVWPNDLPILVRISATDWSPGGWTIEDSVKLASLLKNAGVDLIDCSSGGNIHNAKVPFKPGYQIPFAKAVKGTGILSGAVGMITNADQAEQCLLNGNCDLVLLGRELLRNPYFALHAAEALNQPNLWPNQYLRSRQ